MPQPGNRSPFGCAQRDSDHDKLKLSYFEQENILHFIIAEEAEANSLELSPNITVELNEKGELIGIEILQASTFVCDVLMEGIQAKVLQLNPAGKEPREPAT